MDRRDDSKISRSHGRGLWRKILMQWFNFQQCITWKLGRGNRIIFWEDDWIGDDSQKEISQNFQYCPI